MSGRERERGFAGPVQGVCLIGAVLAKEIPRGLKQANIEVLVCDRICLRWVRRVGCAEGFSGSHVHQCLKLGLVHT